MSLYMLEFGQDTTANIPIFAKRAIGVLINTSSEELGSVSLLKEGH